MRTQVLTTASPNLSTRLFYFLMVGGIAALVHLLIVLGLVSHWQIHPLIANVIAFLIAFHVSFLGHKHLTFSKLKEQKQLSLPHFFIVAASAGIVNECLYFLILRYTQLNYLVALILVLGMVSVYSYVVSKCWACR